MAVKLADIFIFLVGFAYNAFLTGLFSSGDPRKKYYHKALQPGHFRFHLSAAAAWAILWAGWLHKFYGLAPLLTLSSLFLINTLLKPRLKRDVYLMVRGDTIPPDRQWYEHILALILLLLSMLAPLCLYKLLQ